MKKLLAAIGMMVAIFPATAERADQAVQKDPITKTILLDMGRGCRIRLEVPLEAEGGALRGEPAENVQGRANIGVNAPPRARKMPREDILGLNFHCFDAADPITTTWAKRDAKGAWISGLSPRDQEIYKGRFKIFDLHLRAGNGWAVRVDEAIGDERFRPRDLHYCLIHLQKALCGDSTMGYLSDIRRSAKNDLTPYALRILNSVEFLDDSNPPPSSVVPTPATKN